MQRNEMMEYYRDSLRVSFDQGNATRLSALLNHIVSNDAVRHFLHRNYFETYDL